MILYANIMPRRFEGWTIGPLTIMRPASRGDAALHRHEEKHREQFYRNPLRACLYPFSKRIRQEMEVEAFRAQLAGETDGAEYARCAANLCTNYRLDLTYEQARKLLRYPTAQESA